MNLISDSRDLFITRHNFLPSYFSTTKKITAFAFSVLEKGPVLENRLVNLLSWEGEGDWICKKKSSILWSCLFQGNASCYKNDLTGMFLT